MTKRQIELPADARDTVDRAIEHVDRRLSSETDTADVVAELLADLFGDRDAYQRYRNGESLSPITEARLRAYDPRNAFVETERWAEQDPAKLRESKCLLYLWRCFDASPLANDTAFALPFRETLANHLFAEAGDGLRLFSGIKIQCGHNIEMGDDVVVHNDVLLDDRGELAIGDRVSIADRAHVHTHNHDVVDQTVVENYHTIVDDDARVTQGALVRAGVRVGKNAIVGSRAVVQNDVPDHHIAVGMPAKSIKIKPGWESEAEPVDEAGENRQAERRIDYDLPDDLDSFDEFQRDLNPPDA
jgi:acetyltransferase-like isoleucine patch superfamily enzyme